MIRYVNSAAGIAPTQLGGFFEGWRAPPSADGHLSMLQGSDHVVLAIDHDRTSVVGHITAITDGIASAFIPMLEVLAEYRGRGIGHELVLRMLAQLSDYPSIDLTCDQELQPFYERFGMHASVGMVIRAINVPPR
jgi:ribosomal protein S18 acetylase RimI-like enzyme